MPGMISSYLRDVKRELLLLEWQITNDAVWKEEGLAEITVIQAANIPSLAWASRLGALGRVSAVSQLCGNYSEQEVNQVQVPMNFPSQGTML